MKTVNFTVAITDLKGKKMVQGKDEVMMNQILANTISMAKAKKNPVGQLDLALKIYNSKKEMVIEEAEIEIVKLVVSEAQLSSLVAGQILKALEGVKKDGKGSKK